MQAEREFSNFDPLEIVFEQFLHLMRIMPP